MQHIQRDLVVAGAPLKLFMLSNEQGAETPLFCATAPDAGAESGSYYNRCAVARSIPGRLT